MFKNYFSFREKKVFKSVRFRSVAQTVHNERYDQPLVTVNVAENRIRHEWIRLKNNSKPYCFIFLNSQTLKIND